MQIHEIKQWKLNKTWCRLKPCVVDETMEMVVSSSHETGVFVLQEAIQWVRANSGPGRMRKEQNG